MVSNEQADELIRAQTPRPLTQDDIREDSKLLHLLPTLYMDKGLIDDGMRAVLELSAVDIPQYSLPAVLIHIANALAGKICYEHVHPTCFFVRVGSTSTGKTSTDKSLKAFLSPYFQGVALPKKEEDAPSEMTSTFYGPTDFASGPGLLRAIQKQPRCLMVMDEMTYVFASTRTDGVQQGKTHALLELATAAGSHMSRVYGDTGNNITIDGGVVNIIGNATPGIFRAFTLDDLSNGLLQRFDFWCYDGPALYRQKPSHDKSSANVFTKGLIAIHSAEKPAGRYDLIKDGAVDIGATPDAEVVLTDYSREIVDDVNAEQDEGVRGILSRRYDAAIKFALIHAGATRAFKQLFLPLTVADIGYGKMLADILAGWKINVMAGLLSAGEFDNLCRLFVEGAKSAVTNGKKPTGRLIVNRRPRLKNVPPRQFDDIIKALRARKLITVVDAEGQSTVYLPLVSEPPDKRRRVLA